MADILASDINNIKTKVDQVLSTGAASFGYGQTSFGNSVTAGQIIYKADWDAIRYNILNAYVHQTGLLPPATIIGVSDLITDAAGGALQNYNYFADLLQNNRFEIAIGQFSISSIDTKTTSSSWGTTAESTLTVTFSNATDARYFFNSGGRFRISTSLTPPASPTAQTNAWVNLLSAAGSVDFGANPTNLINFYTLTTTFQTYFSRSSSTPYSANAYQLQAKCDVADNSLGTATVVTIRIYLNDSYVDPGAPAPGDLVSGTLTLTAEQLTAIGTLEPTAVSWVVPTPSSSVLSSIAVS